MHFLFCVRVLQNAVCDWLVKMRIAAEDCKYSLLGFKPLFLVLAYLVLYIWHVLKSAGETPVNCGRSEISVSMGRFRMKALRLKVS